MKLFVIEAFKSNINMNFVHTTFRNHVYYVLNDIKQCFSVPLYKGLESPKIRIYIHHPKHNAHQNLHSSIKI